MYRMQRLELFSVIKKRKIERELRGFSPLNLNLIDQTDLNQLSTYHKFIIGTSLLLLLLFFCHFQQEARIRAQQEMNAMLKKQAQEKNERERKEREEDIMYGRRLISEKDPFEVSNPPPPSHCKRKLTFCAIWLFVNFLYWFQTFCISRFNSPTLMYETKLIPNAICAIFLISKLQQEKSVNAKKEIGKSIMTNKYQTCFAKSEFSLDSLIAIVFFLIMNYRCELEGYIYIRHKESREALKDWTE